MRPRKLPKLKPINGKTQEDLINKQKKAEEKRQKILESKKQKARKFLTKHDHNESSNNDEKTNVIQDDAEEVLQKEIDNLQYLMEDEKEELNAISNQSKLEQSLVETPIVIADRNI